ncbi:hypothetical protein D9M70_587630 [compost metagenome]
MDLPNLPTAEGAAGNSIRMQDIPAVTGALAVARNVESVEVTISQRQPVERAVDTLEGFPKDDFHFLRASRSRRRVGTVFLGHVCYSWTSAAPNWAFRALAREHM